MMMPHNSCADNIISQFSGSRPCCAESRKTQVSLYHFFLLHERHRPPQVQKIVEVEKVVRVPYLVEIITRPAAVGEPVGRFLAPKDPGDLPCCPMAGTQSGHPRPQGQEPSE